MIFLLCKAGARDTDFFVELMAEQRARNTIACGEEITHQVGVQSI